MFVWCNSVQEIVECFVEGKLKMLCIMTEMNLLMSAPIVIKRHFACLWGVLVFFLLFSQVQAKSGQDIALPSGTDVFVEVYGKAQPVRVLWIASSFGTNDRHRKMAADLAKLKLQVWQVDLAEALFLPRGAPSSRQIPGELVAELIDHLAEGGKYKILLLSSAYGAIPVLRGAYAWQLSRPKQRHLLGAVLISPYLYTHVPEIGSTPELILETSATSIPLYIFQAQKNTNRWHLPAMLKQLRQHATVYTEMMQGATSIFYRKDTAAETMQLLQTVPNKIARILPLLKSVAYPLKPAQLANRKETKNKLGLDDTLKPYKGQIMALPVNLQDVSGKQVALSDYRGKVTVINFWATWCPPCVEEIPSLNRLRSKMQGKAFELISVNYGESAAEIKKFMARVAVDFPVLLDPDGKTAGQWRVVAFPSTFVIGPDGQIRYGVNAAIHWDTDEVVQQLERLLR